MSKWIALNESRIGCIRVCALYQCSIWFVPPVSRAHYRKFRSYNEKKSSKHVFLLIRATHYSQKPYGNVIFEPVYGGSGDSYAACFEMWAQGMYLLHASVSSLADVFLLLCVHNFTTHPRCQCSVDFRMQLFLQGDQAPAGTG